MSDYKQIARETFPQYMTDDCNVSQIAQKAGFATAAAVAVGAQAADGPLLHIHCSMMKHVKFHWCACCFCGSWCSCTSASAVPLPQCCCIFATAANAFTPTVFGAFVGGSVAAAYVTLVAGKCTSSAAVQHVPCGEY